MSDDAKHNPRSHPDEHPVEANNYDAHIIPAETAARMEREKGAFKHTPASTSPENAESIDTTEGYTVDKEGLINNYAIEPEMYYEEPGDRAAMIEEEKAAREEELHDINDNDETGKLTMEKDTRGRGPGII